jgi:hypothetical protein
LTHSETQLPRGGDHIENLVSGFGGAGGIAACHAALLKVFYNFFGDFLIPYHLVFIHELPPFNFTLKISAWKFTAASYPMWSEFQMKSELHCLKVANFLFT